MPNDESDKENRPPPGVARKRKQNADGRTQKKKRPEASTKEKKKKEEASVIARHPGPTVQVSLLSFSVGPGSI